MLDGDIAAKFVGAVLARPRAKKLLSSDHFSVDGTLIEAWASMNSVEPKDGSGEPPVEGGGAMLKRTSTVGVTAAVANTVYHATGKRVRDLPITLDKLNR